MIWLWILGILLALTLLLCLQRLGVQIAFGETMTATLCIGPFHIQVAPTPTDEKSQKKQAKRLVKKEEKAKRQASEKKASPGEILGKLKQLPKPELSDVKDAVCTLWPPLKRALERTRKGVRISPLTLSVTLGGRDDPAETAQLYGYVHAAVWTVMPVLEQLLVIPDPAIHIGMDFDRAQTEIKGALGLSIRLGTLMAMGFGMAIPSLKWFLRFRKRKQAEAAAQPKQQQAQPTEPSAA